MERLIFRVIHSYMCEYMESVKISNKMTSTQFVDANMDLLRFIRLKIDHEFKVFPAREDFLKAAELFKESYYRPKLKPD